MNKVTAQNDYRSILKAELEGRSAKNSAYSLRSFARDLDISPARLSDVLRGRYGFSRAAAEKIAKTLGWSKSETVHFADLVESSHARTTAKREAALSRVHGRLNFNAAKSNYQQLTLDSFHVVSDWYHYALLELMTLPGFKPEPAWIGKSLGISAHSASAALERLERLEMVERDASGNLTPSNDFTASPDGIPSEAIKKFHRQILEKALLSIDFQTVAERDLSSMILAVDSEDLPEAKAEIKRFRRKFDARFGQKKSRNAVYCLSTQFFRLQPKTQERK